MIRRQRRESVKCGTGADPINVYWDANIFLAYLEEDDPEPTVLDGILRTAATDPGTTIVTSALSIAEVAFVATESHNVQLTEDELRAIDQLWTHAGIEVVNVDRRIARAARDLMRAAIPRGWRLKPPDAIHLATALHSGVTALHTYDMTLGKYEALIGIPVGAPSSDGTSVG